MELQIRPAKIAIKQSCTKELQTGVANSGAKRIWVKRSWKQQSQNGVAKRSRKRTSKRLVTTTKQEMQKITYFEAPLLDCFWLQCPRYLHSSLLSMETCFQVS